MCRRIALPKVPLKRCSSPFPDEVNRHSTQEWSKEHLHLWLPQDRNRLLWMLQSAKVLLKEQSSPDFCGCFSVQSFTEGTKLSRAGFHCQSLKEENRLLTHSVLVNIPSCPELTFVVVVRSNLFQLLGPQTHAQNLKYVPATSIRPEVRGGSSADHSHF